jgi:hypothetical protein
MINKTYENIRKIREMNDLTRDYVAAELKNEYKWLWQNRTR